MKFALALLDKKGGIYYYGSCGSLKKHQKTGKTGGKRLLGKSLDAKTVERLCEEWDKRSGRGSFVLHAIAWLDPDGKARDAISIVDHPNTPNQKISAIFDYEM